MTKFVVDLGNVPITKAQEKTIAAAIQGVVLNHLADVPALQAAPQPCLLPIRWIGLIMRPTVGELTAVEQQNEPFAAGP
jgi:hypothetical protein